MGVYLIPIIIIVILVILLIYSLLRSTSAVTDKDHLVRFKDAALDISERIASDRDSSNIIQHILESCFKLIPRAKFGMILVFNPEGLLTIRASVGFSRSSASDFSLKLEETFLYLATDGKLKGPVIINRIDDILRSKGDDDSEGQNSAIKSEISTPLYVDGELFGLLCLNGDKKDIFLDRDLYVLEYMANQIGIIVNHQKLFTEINDISKHDTLTHMLNRRSFESELDKLLTDPSKDAGALYFVLMDLDDLKVANDMFGHAYGDKIIQNYTEIIKRCLGKNDFCGRFGGDEFVAVIQGDYLHVNFILDEARKEFMKFKKSSFQEQVFVPDFSYGYASFREGLGDTDTFYKLAYQRLQEMRTDKQNDKMQEVKYIKKNDRPGEEMPEETEFESESEAQI